MIKSFILCFSLSRTWLLSLKYK